MAAMQHRQINSEASKRDILNFHFKRHVAEMGHIRFFAATTVSAKNAVPNVRFSHPEAALSEPGLFFNEG
jgi:hypothetical protein